MVKVGDKKYLVIVKEGYVRDCQILKETHISIDEGDNWEDGFGGLIVGTYAHDTALGPIENFKEKIGSRYGVVADGIMLSEFVGYF